MLFGNFGICTRRNQKEPEEIQNLDELISPLIKKGQTIAHVYNSHKDAMICSRSTLYKYINESVLTAKSVDLPRKVKYKMRKKNGPVRYSKATQLSVLTRNYERFKKHMEENPDTNVVEMDTVVRPVYSKKALLTLLFRSCNLRSKAGILGSSSAEMKAKGNIYKKSSKMNI